MATQWKRKEERRKHTEEKEGDEEQEEQPLERLTEPEEGGLMSIHPTRFQENRRTVAYIFSQSSLLIRLEEIEENEEEEEEEEEVEEDQDDIVPLSPSDVMHIRRCALQRECIERFVEGWDRQYMSYDAIDKDTNLD